MKRIMFVCHGNICRSPLAELLFKDMIKKAGLGLAMENACSELKTLAGAVVCRNTEHVVEHILKHYFSNETLFFKEVRQGN